MDTFVINYGLDLDGKATAGEKVWFQVGFQNTIGYVGSVAYWPRNGSVNIDYGDGTAEHGAWPGAWPGWTAPQTADRPADPHMTITFPHVYTKPGTFHAFLKEGLLDQNRPCAPSGGVGPGGGIQVNVKRAKHADAALQVPALTQPKSVVAILPASGLGAKDLGVYEKVGKERNLTYALSPGHIGGASVSQSSLGNVLKVEGSGRCGLKVFEELDGKAVEIYDYKGPLPTTISMVNTLPGMHVAKLEGDKSSEGCGGTASASFSIARPGRASRR